MSRRRAAPTVARNHVFPFLAVLICTMGALVTLLVVIAQLSHQAGTAEGAAMHGGDDAEPDLDEALWRLSELQASREKTAADLGESQLELSHLEDHLRRLRDRLAGLQAAAAGLEDAHAAQSANGASSELEQVRRQIAEAQSSLAAAQQDQATRRPSYAVVPYVGPHGTQRRPIYLECRGDAIVLQPEGIELSAADLSGPLGPGNPLAAATRAVREHWAQAPDALAEGEPYPFLLVRPDGILAYAVARKALSSWGADFGYEFIDGDWSIEYPPSDPQLAQTARIAAEMARRQQQALVLAAPRHYGQPGGRGRGGGRGTGFTLPGEAGSMGGGGFGSGSPAAGFAAGEGGTPRSTGQRGGTTAAGGARGAAASEVALGPIGAGPTKKSDEPREPSLITDPIVPGEKQTNDREADSSTLPTSLARKRGRDWGLPEARAGATAVTRPILVQCWSDKLIVPAADGRGQKEIALPAKTQDGVDELVAAVWQHVKSWGIAGKNLYWRPTLTLDVLPGAEARYEDLRALLAESGLDVGRREDAPRQTRGPARINPIR